MHTSIDMIYINIYIYSISIYVYIYTYHPKFLPPTHPSFIPSGKLTELWKITIFISKPSN